MSPLQHTEAPTARATEIREVAGRMFAEKGYDSTSIEDIAGAVGMLPGSLYHHIDSKQQLLFEVIASVHARAVEHGVAVRARGGSAAERLRVAIEAHVTFNLEERVDVGVFFDDFRSLDEQQRELVARERARYAAALRALVEEGQTTGDLRPDLDPGLTVLAVLGMMNWVHRWYDPTGEQGVDEIATGLADLAMRGLAGRASREVAGGGD